MTEVERLLRDAGCPKLDLQIRRGNQEAIRFYQRIGFSEDAMMCYAKRLIADD